MTNAISSTVWLDGDAAGRHHTLVKLIAFVYWVESDAFESVIADAVRRDDYRDVDPTNMAMETDDDDCRAGQSHGLTSSASEATRYRHRTDTDVSGLAMHLPRRAP